MKKVFLLIISLLASIVLTECVFALDTNSCVVLENESKIGVKDVDLLEKKLKEKINYLNTNSKYFYSYEIKKINSRIIEEQKNLENVKVEIEFKSEEDALNYFNNIQLDNNYIKGNYTIEKINNSSIGENKTKICSSYNCEEEIEYLSKNYEFENLGIDSKEVVEEKEILYDDKFKTENEAYEFAKKNIPDGYSFVQSEVILDVLSEYESKTFFELMGVNTFETLEEAQKKLEEFKLKYNGTGTIEEKEIVEEYTLNETYTSLEEIMNKIKELKNQGYTIDYKVETSSNITSTVANARKLDKDSKYELSNPDYVLIKQGIYNLALWTENELSDEEKIEFIKSYNEKNNVDGSTRNITKEQITFIHGYTTHDLSYLGKNWGTYKFSKDNNKVILECNKDKVSHIVYGAFERNIYEYRIIGTYKKSIFQYTVIGEAQVPYETKLYKVSATYSKKNIEYTLNYRINDIEYFYELSYDKYILDSYEISDVDYEIIRCDYPEDYPIPPHTDINNKVSYKLYILVLLALFGLISFVSKKFKIKKYRSE